MNKCKLFIIIALLFGFFTARCQYSDSALDRLDFNDKSLIDSETLKNAITDYMTMVQKASQSQSNPSYNLILAADNIMSRCYTSYPMYKFVFQYLIYGFSEMGANIAVDYMISLPYFQYVNPTATETQEMLAIAESYNRVKIGSPAPDINAVTIKGAAFDMYDIETQYVILLFWSYSCQHCRDLIKDFGRFMRKNKDFSIVTVNVSGDLKKVRRMIRKNHLRKYYNICDGQGWNSPIVEDFAVNATPSIILLDENKTIIGKPFDIEELISITKQ